MRKNDCLTIAIPREIMAGERRVAAIPKTVQKLVESGFRVLVETGAGKMAFYEDEEYAQAGAVIMPGAAEVYQNADIILKVKEPKFNEKIGKHEIDLFPEKSILISFLHPASPANHEMVKMLAEKGITSFTLDGIPRISRAQQMDALTSMSTVAGYKSVLIAANNLGRFIPMMPTASGVLRPSTFIVVGAGVAGLQAIATARRLGAKVKVLDIRPDANEQAKSLGAEVISFDLPDGMGIGEGGYARRLPEEWYIKEREILASHMKESDAIILAALIPGEEAPILVNESMLQMMKKGSVVVDISIDQGGNCEITRRGEEYYYQGIFICGLLNIPAYLPIDAANMFAQNIYYYFNNLVQEGKVNINLDDEIISRSLVTKDNKIVHEGTLKAMKRH